MVDRNPSLAQLAPSYLFQEINQKKRALLQEMPSVELLDMGIGDTTQPIPPSAGKAMAEAVLAMTEPRGYRGYGPEQGLQTLQEALSQTFYPTIDADEVFISDGAKCDTGRLQVLFGPDVTVALQDPSYPVYRDGSLLMGVKPESMTPLPCLPENDFFPTSFPNVDLFYICSPNNPTGYVATHNQLKALVDHAKETGAIILFDAGYASFISDPTLPKTIYEILGAEEVAIEIGSFSKMAGFTGLRLGWTVVPKALKFRSGDSVHAAWKRVIGTIFNGASRIIQQGGLALLSNLHEVDALIDYYQTNARLLKEALVKAGMEVYGGDHAPYLWVRFPGKSSWEMFHQLLEEVHCVAIPGIGFGPAGEGFVRFSALGFREGILQAVERLSSLAQGQPLPTRS